MTICPFERHQDAADPLYHKAPVMKTLPFFQPSDFTYDEEARTWVCPAGKPLESQDRHARGARSMPNVSARSSPCSGMRYNKGLDRFTLRGRTKVDGQWKLFCLVHNIEKLARHGYAR